MLNLRSEDIFHKSQLNRLLIEIIDRPALSLNLAFKGGTCAAMLGYLDRFSVDLDFDVLKNVDEAVLRKELHQVFDDQSLTIVEELNNALMFRLRYPGKPGQRSTMKVSANNQIVKANKYQVLYLAEVDRMMNCQTVETMLANKLVAVTDRYNLHGTIAGRDIYDIHHFFVHGYAYNPQVILERTGLVPEEYFEKLSDFIKKHVTQTIINEDLNTLLPYQQFQQIRKVLIPETLALLEREQGKRNKIEETIPQEPQ
jgi:predicted nucleotidyltransferase component of viral defense system